MQWDYLLNDQLKRVKTKGMSNPKNMPFLMCPAANGDALGGTPAASAASGGHIKKSAWLHVHTAALSALAPLLAARDERNQQANVESHERGNTDDEKRDGHGLLLGGIEQALNGEHDVDNTEVAGEDSENELKGFEVHGLLVEGVNASSEDKASDAGDCEQSDQREDELHAEGEGLPEGEHGSLAFVESRAALVVAASANRFYSQRLEVVAVVVVDRWGAAISARELALMLKASLADRSRNLVVRLLLIVAVELVDGHGSDLSFLLGAATLHALVQVPQLVADFKRGRSRLPSRQVADGRLMGANSCGNLHLRQAGGAEVAEEFGPVHTPYYGPSHMGCPILSFYRGARFGA